MDPAETSREPEPRLTAYRFAGVVLDLRRGCLVVDGSEVPAAPLLLQLLQQLCEADGRLLSRQELFDALWPGGQVVSEAALSQLIWRLRALLGSYGSLVATVRRGGVRLDAAVETEFWTPRPAAVPAPGEALREQPGTPAASDAGRDAPFASAPGTERPAAPPAQGAADAVDPLHASGVMSAPSPGAVTPATRARAWPRRRLWTAAALIAVVGAAVAAVQWWRHDPLVSDGYALYASDLQASRRDSAAIAAAAFAADKAGDRERATALMRSLHDADPTTPVPAAMLAWWRSFASASESAVWRDAALARLGPDTPPYLRLYVDYFLARSGTGSIRGPLNALLDLRPDAWHFQYTRAHNQLANREFAGALRSLQQIPLTLPDTRLLADVLVDRVSLGDRAAAALATAQPQIAASPLYASYVRGRVAYSEGRLAEAIAAWDQSADIAAEIRQYERQLTASESASLAAIERGSADALPRLSATRRLCQSVGRVDCETAMLGFVAVMEAQRGEAQRASASLAEAWRLNPHTASRPALLLIALENELALPGDPAEFADELAQQPAFAGVNELLRGWQALAGGDHAAAGRALDLALERGVAQTYNAEDAALLGVRLGRPTTPCRVDPPYPNVLRISACLQLRRLQETTKNQQPVPL